MLIKYARKNIFTFKDFNSKFEFGILQVSKYNICKVLGRLKYSGYEFSLAEVWVSELIFFFEKYEKLKFSEIH